MDIIIQSLGFNAGENLEVFIREKIGSLNSDKIIRANVTLYLGPEAEPQNNYCEIRLEVPGNDPFVKRSSPYFETAVTECVDALAEILKRAKEKNLDRRQAEAAEIQDMIITDSIHEDDPDLEDVVR
ncbi:MAG TPA: HPF/RaiA family ribosome-associated protein [Ferruginibacter sp.]|nr:HPF/RaiA family ribosome-associated protein [Ferruginibacter sp.]